MVKKRGTSVPVGVSFGRTALPSLLQLLESVAGGPVSCSQTCSASWPLEREMKETRSYGYTSNQRGPRATTWPSRAPPGCWELLLHLEHWGGCWMATPELVWSVGSRQQFLTPPGPGPPSPGSSCPASLPGLQSPCGRTLTAVPSAASPGHWLQHRGSGTPGC